MVQIAKLKWEIDAQGYTDEEVAWHLGISTRCWKGKLRSGRFGTQDILLLTELLELECPEDIFFV